MISVLIPAYNAEKTIKRCIDSVLAQTLRDFEVVVVNDGSKDNTLDILQDYAQKNSKIKVIDQQNQGVAATRNTLLMESSGDSFLFVDADDWIEPDMLERLVSLMEDADIVFCGSDHAETTDDTKAVDSVDIESWNQEQQLLEFMKHKRMTGMLWNKLIRRSTADGCYFNPKTGYGEDAEFLWQVLKKSQKMVVTDEILYHHTMEEASISHLSFSDKKYSAIPMWESIVADVRKNYPELLNLAKERLMCAAVFSGYEIRKSGYQNTEQIHHIREIVKENLQLFLKSPNISKKMKLFAVGIRGGYCDKVSIIIPIYNTEKYVGKCIESVLNQTYSNLEVILVNDGSTDRSEEICAEYEQKDNRVLLFSKANAGVSAARNFGLDLSTGDYVLFIDSDDTIETNMIEVLVKNLVESNADISCCQYDKGHIFRGKSLEVWNRDTALQQFLIHKRINGSLVNKLIKQDAIGDVRLDTSIRYGEDALFLWKVLLHAEMIVVTDKVLYHVTLHDDSASGGGSYKPIRRDCVRVWKKICDDAEVLGEPYREMARAQLGNMAFFSLYAMAYYKYLDNNTEHFYCEVLRDTIGAMGRVNFIPKSELLLSRLFICFPPLGRQAVLLKRKLKSFSS